MDSKGVESPSSKSPKSPQRVRKDRKQSLAPKREIQTCQNNIISNEPPTDVKQKSDFGGYKFGEVMKQQASHKQLSSPIPFQIRTV